MLPGIRGDGRFPTGVSAGKFVTETDIVTNTSVGINTSTVDDNDLRDYNSFQGLYISNGMVIHDNRLNGVHYSTAFNGLMPSQFTIGGTLTIDATMLWSKYLKLGESEPEMTIINQKSISVLQVSRLRHYDDLLTFHSNNGTERFRIDNSNTKITAGIVTTLTVTGNGTVGGTLDVTGNGTVGGTLDVTSDVAHCNGLT